MFKHHVLHSAMLLSFMGLAAYCQDSPLKAEIKLAQTSVKNNEMFFLSAAIRNISGEEQTIVVWTCGYSRQWTADTPSVKFAREDCVANVQVRLKLKPGESYEKKVLVQVTLPAGSNPKEAITFRLGFENETAAMPTPSTVKAAKAAQLWSNALTINVTR